jgi:hypothetical protein
MSKCELQNQINPTISFWEWLLLQNDFKSQIKKLGYYQFNKDILIDRYYKWHGRQEHAGRRGIHSIPTSTKALSSASFGIERLSQTPKILNNNELCLIRAGGGNFIVFDMREFLPPFLSLNWTEYSGTVEKLPTRLPRGYQRLVEQFRTQWNEHTFIQALHFCGAFSSLVERISRHRTTKYVTGPSGPIISRFPFWMKKNGVNSGVSHRLVPFVYEGVVDLDECLYPRDTNIIIPIEAKLQPHPDLAWHKLAFPCYRFIDQPRFEAEDENSSLPRIPALRSDKCTNQIVPVYCAYHTGTRQAIIHVFPKVLVYSGKLRVLSSTEKMRGLIINEKKQMVPAQTFSADMSWI